MSDFKILICAGFFLSSFSSYATTKNLSYLVKPGDCLSGIFDVLGVVKKIGTKEAYRKFYETNPQVVSSKKNKLFFGEFIKLPIEVVPPSNRYYLKGRFIYATDFYSDPFCSRSVKKMVKPNTQPNVFDVPASEVYSPSLTPSSPVVSDLVIKNSAESSVPQHAWHYSSRFALGMGLQNHSIAAARDAGSGTLRDNLLLKAGEISIEATVNRMINKDSFIADIEGGLNIEYSYLMNSAIKDLHHIYEGELFFLALTRESERGRWGFGPQLNYSYFDSIGAKIVVPDYEKFAGPQKFTIGALSSGMRISWIYGRYSLIGFYGYTHSGSAAGSDEPLSLDSGHLVSLENRYGVYFLGINHVDVYARIKLRLLTLAPYFEKSMSKSVSLGFARSF